MVKTSIKPADIQRVKGMGFLLNRGKMCIRDSTWANQSLLFRFDDHIISRTGFNGTTNIDAFVFDDDLGVILPRHVVQPDHRGVSERIKDGIINQKRFPSFY